MKVMITGICGFVGSSLAAGLLECADGMSVCGVDNLSRAGSESNLARLRRLGVEVHHGDIRAASDIDPLPKADWVIDAAANPSVLAGVHGTFSSRRLFENNLAGLVNILEYCKANGAGLLLLSSSRVFSIPVLAGLPLIRKREAFELDSTSQLPVGVSAEGVTREFSTAPPVSLYGATKLASEMMALEYGEAFGFPVRVTRCGVLAGAGQFGTPDQGVFSYWINAHRGRRPLKYCGFEGTGCQVRDALHPQDLVRLIWAQTRKSGAPVVTAGGGPRNAISLARLTAWCNARFGKHDPAPDPNPRRYDIPWLVLSNQEAEVEYGWRREIGLDAILDEIASHAETHPDWLELSGI